MKPLKVVSLLLAVILCMGILCSCKDDAEADSSKNSKSDNNESVAENTMKDTVLAEIEMKDGGVIKLELYHNIAPITVENFVKLAESGFYDGLIFHRVISGFMIQGGDPKGNGTGGPGYTIKGEFAANGIVNNISHKRGVISMARRGDSYDSAGSQFFIMHVDYVGLDGQYAAFGKVTEGLEIVDRIAAVATDYNDKPLTDQTIKTIRITDK